MSTPTNEQIQDCRDREDGLLLINANLRAELSARDERDALRAQLSEKDAEIRRLGVSKQEVTNSLAGYKAESSDWMARAREAEARNERLVMAGKRAIELMHSHQGCSAIITIESALTENGPALGDIKQVRGGHDAPHTSEQRPAPVHPDSARLDDVLQTINASGTRGLTRRYEWGIGLPLDRAAIDAARNSK